MIRALTVKAHDNEIKPHSCHPCRPVCRYHRGVRRHTRRRLRAAVPAHAFRQQGRADACRNPPTSAASNRSALPKDAPNVLIVLIDDVGFGVPDTFGGFAHTPTLSQAARRRHQLQPLSHHLDLLAHARGAAHRPQPPARRQRHHRRARGGLGRLHRRHAEDLRDHRRGAAATTATRPPPSASGTTRPPTRPPRWGRSPTGPPATASTTSTASSPAKPRSGNRVSSKTPPPSSRRTMRSITSPRTWRTRASPG